MQYRISLPLFVREADDYTAEEGYDRAAEESFAKEDALDDEIPSQILRNTRKKLRRARQTVLEAEIETMCARGEVRHAESLVLSVLEETAPP